MLPQLTIPAPAAATDPRLIDKPAQLEQWIGTLPLTDARASIRRVNEALAILNRHTLAPAARLQMLERYRQLYLLFLDFARGPRSGLLAPGAEEPGKPGGFWNLATEMAYGYKILVHQILQQHRHLNQDRIGLLAAHRAMRMLSHLVLHACHHYSALPVHAWREVGLLYAITEDGHQHHGAVIEVREGQQTQSTPAHVLLQTSLCLLADPYRLPQGETWRLYEFLATRLDGVEIVALIPGSEPAPGLFEIDLLSGERPKPLRKEPQEIEDSKRLIDASGLLQQLEEQVTLLQDGNDAFTTFGPGLPPRESAAILGRWLRHWKQSGERHQKRQATGGRVDTAWGLSSAYHHLRAAKGVEDSAPLRSYSSDNQIDIGAISASSFPTLPKVQELHTCHIINESGGGMALECPRPPRDALQVGQMLALRRADGEWLLGTIRWLGQDHIDGVWRAGIQYFAGDVVPVEIRREVDHDSDRYDPALMLHCRDDSRNPVQLIGTKGCFIPNREYALTMPARGLVTVKAIRLIDTSRYYDRIAVTQ